MPRSWRGSYYSSSDDEYPPGITVINTTHSRHGSTTGGTRHHRDHVFLGGDLLSVPSDGGGRHRSSSTGAAPQPQVVNVVVGDRSPERSHKSPERHHKSPERRHKSPERRRRSPERGHSYDRRRGRSLESVSSEEEYRYREHHRRLSKKKSELDAETIVKLDRLKIYEKEEADREYERKLKKEVEMQRAKALYEAGQKEEADREYERKLKKEIEIQKAKESYEAEQKAKKDKELQKEYVERWKREEAEKKEKAKREKEEEDAKFEERFKIQFMQAGYTEAQAEAVLKKKKEKEKKEQNTMAIDLSRPTWIKVKRKWLLPETLDHYYLPWEWDTDSEYIVIKQYVDQELQDRLFEHTRMLRERKMITGPVEKDVVTTLKVRDRSKDQMFLVRRKSKSPGRRS